MRLDVGRRLIRLPIGESADQRVGELLFDPTGNLIDEFNVFATVSARILLPHGAAFVTLAGLDFAGVALTDKEHVRIRIDAHPFCHCL